MSTRVITTKTDGPTLALAVAGIPTVLVGFFAFGLLLGAWKAFVLSKLYGWFLTPLGLPPLTWWHIWGLLMIYGTITYTYKPVEKLADKSNAWGRVASAVISPFLFYAVTLLVGWLITTWGMS
jgi:hypothetical protein